MSNLWSDSLFLKLTFAKHLMPHGDTTFDQSHGDVFPCPAPNCEQIQHTIKKFSVFCINYLPLKNLTYAHQHGGTTLNTFTNF
jgi:gentisate 1,2-dioxygenase